LVILRNVRYRQLWLIAKTGSVLTPWRDRMRSVTELAMLP
jgi:hypothetical protein